MPREDLKKLAVLAFALSAIHVALAWRWVSLDRQPPNWDPSVHLGTALDYKEALAEGRWSDLIATKTRRGHQQYPPAYHYTLIPLLSSPSPQAKVVWLNLAYLALMTATAAWMSYRLGGLWPAATTMAAVALSPRVFHIYREAFVDIAVAAWVVTAYALIIRSGFFAGRGWSWAVGACAGLAALSKFDAPVYLLPGVCAGLGDGVRRKNLARALGLAALIAGPWYLVNGAGMAPRVWTAFFLGHKQGNPLTWTLSNWTYYPRFLSMCYWWPAALLMAAGAAAGVAASLKRSDEPSRIRRLLAAWLAWAYLFCTLTPSKDYRYFLDAAPVLPALGFASLPAPLLAASAAMAVSNLRDIRRPDPGDWRLDDVLAAVRERKQPGPASLCLLMNHRNFNSLTIEWTARYAGFKDVFVACSQTEIPEWADFVLLKTGDPGAFFADGTLRIAEEARQGGGLFGKVFREAGRWSLPDRSELVLYELRPDLPALARVRRIKELKVKRARLEGVVISPSGPGRYEISVRALTLEKLPAPIRDLRLRLDHAKIIEDQGRFYILHVGAVDLVRARASWKDLSAAVSGRSRVPVVLSRSEDGVHVRARAGPVPLELWLRAAVSAEAAEVRVEAAAVAGIRVPFVSGRRLRWSLSPAPPYQPYSLKVSPVRWTDEGVSIGL